MHISIGSSGAAVDGVNRKYFMLHERIALTVTVNPIVSTPAPAVVKTDPPSGQEGEGEVDVGEHGDHGDRVPEDPDVKVGNYSISFINH